MALPNAHAVRDWTTAGSSLGIVALMVMFLFEQRIGEHSPADTVSIGEVTRSVSRLEGSITTLTTTVTAQLGEITKAIQDGTRRMDRIENRLDSFQSIVESHARSITALEGHKP